MFSRGLREELEKSGFKFVATDNRGKVLEGEHAGEKWVAAYGGLTTGDGRFSKPKSRGGVQFSTEEVINAVNERFNKELEEYEQGRLEKGHRFYLGHPSPYLLSAGFGDLPISMRAALLSRKAGDDAHPFEPADLRDLVQAIQKPIEIFHYSKDNMRNLIVDVTHGDKHFLVGVTLNYKANGIEINSVSGLFPKESHEWLKWIQDGKHIRIDQKEKVLNLIDSLRTNPAESERIGLNLDGVAKVVKTFENPTLPGEKSGEKSGNTAGKPIFSVEEANSATVSRSTQPGRTREMFVGARGAREALPNVWIDDK